MAKFFEVEKKAFQVLEGGVGMVVGAFEESCGVGGFQGGRFMKITEFVTKRKTLILVVLEGVKGNGWEALRKAISLVQDFSDQVVRALKETIEDSQVSKGIYRGCRSYADVVAEEEPKNGALLPVGK
ncbi:hypothetical protein CK203_092340 [Vitis vinifera]|uniref:Uncharacterized protein n=1 Tax=Vitis vinifera TaxID=29760 RepID=A0A438DYA3_VITVI|nr:hypothetical protein CK203_092340 [Vitis vinifera]